MLSDDYAATTSAFFPRHYAMINRTGNGMTEIMPFPENNYETVLLDRPKAAFKTV